MTDRNTSAGRWQTMRRCSGQKLCRPPGVWHVITFMWLYVNDARCDLCLNKMRPKGDVSE